MSTAQEVKKKTWYSQNGQSTIKQINGSSTFYILWSRATFMRMNSCGVHIEVTHSLDTDSYMIALRQMIARRGNVRTIYSDNGSNFIRAENELKKALEEMDDKKIKLLCKNLVVIGLSGSETHLLQATWVVSGKGNKNFMITNANSWKGFP